MKELYYKFRQNNQAVVRNVILLANGPAIQNSWSINLHISRVHQNKILSAPNMEDS
jgi:hypothetical protein